MEAKDLERFLNLTFYNPTGCWLWSGSCDTSGYGLFRLNGKLEKAHRVSYKQYKSKIPDGMLVCHTCDTPNCVNPMHLFLGTHKDNSEDRDNKGRGRLPYQSGQQMKKILSVEQQEEIKRQRYFGITQRELATNFGVSQNVIFRVIHGEY